MYWTDPGDLGGGGCTRADIVDSTDVATIEADTVALTEHDRVGRVGGGEREERGCHSRIVFRGKRVCVEAECM